MATSLVGPFGVERAFPAAPVPRPPQPTRATWIVLFSPAWTCGSATPARADAIATCPDCFIISRRDRPLFVVLLTAEFLRSWSWVTRRMYLSYTGSPEET